MKAPIPYTYVISTRRRMKGTRFSVSAKTAQGEHLLGTHKSFRRALSTARMLAAGVGSIEVRV